LFFDIPRTTQYECFFALYLIVFIKYFIILLLCIVSACSVCSDFFIVGVPETDFFNNEVNCTAKRDLLLLQSSKPMYTLKNQEQTEHVDNQALTTHKLRTRRTYVKNTAPISLETTQ